MSQFFDFSVKEYYFCLEIRLYLYRNVWDIRFLDCFLIKIDKE